VYNKTLEIKILLLISSLLIFTSGCSTKRTIKTVDTLLKIDKVLNAETKIDPTELDKNGLNYYAR
jgi:hypothetical protein